MQEYELEVAGESAGTCECCGDTTRRIWGNVHRAGCIVAVYFWTWTEGAPDHGAHIDLVMGQWGEGTTTANRQVAAIEFRMLNTGPAFRVVDTARQMPTIAKHSLPRSQIVGTPLAQQIFDLLDVIWLDDMRLDELHSW